MSEVKKAPEQELTEQQQIDAIVAKVAAAQKIFATYTQEQVDKIFKAACLEANKQRIPLAYEAHEETGRGLVEDKIIKNHYAAEYIWYAYKDTQTVGYVEVDESAGFRKLLAPIGVVAGIVPTTNPTSTAIFKCLLCLKTRNGLIFSPHPAAKKSTVHAAKIVLDAAVAAGAPEGLIGWIEEPTIQLSGALMNHPGVNLILATGGPGMVKAAYSCGKPAVGVGPGNTPAFIDATADIKMAVSSVIISKTFDNGMICASEQAVIAEASNYKEIKDEFIKRGCYFLKPDEKKKLTDFFFPGGKLNAKVVGMKAAQIAEWAGITVDPATKILIGECDGVRPDDAFCYEKLSPILGFFKAKNFEDGVDIAHKLIMLGGTGHTSALYTAKTNREHMDYFAGAMPTGRVLVNQPSSQGGIGDIYNFKLAPSLTLGCGSWGKNSTSENVGVKHLMNIKQVAERRENTLWHRVPPKIYFKAGSMALALTELPGKKCFIVTDKTMTSLGQAKKVTDLLDKYGIDYRIFDEVLPDPTLGTVKNALHQVDVYQPDSFIALGGGSAIDACKLTWLMYEHPELKFEDLAARFCDIRKRVEIYPEMGKKAYMCAISTTSGTGSEVTPFAVITDEVAGKKYPLADYTLTPNMAIIDADFVMTMPKGLCAASGIDALVHSIEAYTSMLHSSFADAHALEATRLIFKNLPASYAEGAANPKARTNMHHAAGMAGIAFANAFLGICHSLAHKLGARFHVPHGFANAMLINYCIDFNCTEAPVKMGMFPQYEYPEVMERYADMADACGFTKDSDDTWEKCRIFVKKIEELKAAVNIPKNIKEFLDGKGITEAVFLAQVDAMALEAYDDQCTGANARYPLVSELKDIYLKAYYGEGYDLLK